VISALDDGAIRIVLCEVFLAVSNHTAEGESLVDALEIEERLGVGGRKTGPLWDSGLSRRVFVGRAGAHLAGVPKDEVAVLLVGARPTGRVGQGVGH